MVADGLANYTDQHGPVFLAGSGHPDVEEEAVFFQWVLSVPHVWTREVSERLIYEADTGIFHVHRIIRPWKERIPLLQLFNTLRPRQNGYRFGDDIFKCILLNENVWILIEISLKLVQRGSINPALVQIMAWRRTGNNPLSELMMD